MSSTDRKPRKYQSSAAIGSKSHITVPNTLRRRTTNSVLRRDSNSSDSEPETFKRERLSSAQFKQLLVKSFQEGGDALEDMVRRGSKFLNSKAKETYHQLAGLTRTPYTTDDLEKMRRDYVFDPNLPTTTLPWRRRKLTQDEVRIFSYVDPLLKLYQQAARSKGTPLPPPERETISFVLGVCDVILTTILVSNWPNLYCFYHTTRFIILMYFRIFEFFGRHWGSCLIEVCYFINILLMWYISGRGHWSEENLKPIFLLCNGPVMWGAIIFQNSLVFHSVTKYTSTVLHFSPPLTCWTLRWKVSMPSTTQPILGESWSDFFYGFNQGVGLFCGHQIFWWFIIGFLLKSRLKKDKEASNCFICLTESKSGSFYSIINVFGEKYEELLFIVLYSFGATLAMVPALFFWNSFILHTTVLAAVLILLIWNAGDFYIHRQELTVNMAREVYSNKNEFGG